MADAPRYRPPERDREAIQEVLRCIEEGKRWHNRFARKVERRYDSWRGLQSEAQETPRGWRSDLHPPHLINIVEGMLSTIEEANPVWKVHPRAIPGMTMDEAMSATDGSELSSYLLTHQMRVDGFSDKAGPLAHQDLIAGYTVGKVYWLKKEAKIWSLDSTPELIYDESGGTIDIAESLQDVEEIRTIRDDPTLEVRDVRDFMWPESATSIETSPWVIDRTFVSYSTLQKMEQLGIYKNVKYLKETRYDDSQPQSDQVKTREQKLRGADRTRGLVEVVELWTDDKVVTVANGAVLLRNRHTPFRHSRKPFVVCSAIPDLFQIPGVSVIEGLAQLQEMLWTLTNLRIDSTRIAASVITMIRGDVDDPEQYEFAPEAQWIVPDPNAVRTLDMTAAAQASRATLEAEGLIRGDIQNIMGGLPFTGGAQSQTLSTDTATGMSIITNIAQAILQRRKAQYMKFYGRIGQLFLELDQQFLREDRLVPVLGEGGSRRWLELAPQDIQGIYDVEVEMTGESLMKQERQASSQSLLTMAMQGAGVSAQMGVKLNLRRFWEKVLDSHDVADKATFFEEMPQAQPQQAPPPGAPGTPPGAQGILDQMTQGSLPAGGITNKALAAGPTSPSSPVTMSPSAPMQQSLARNGAGRSA